MSHDWTCQVKNSRTEPIWLALSHEQNRLDRTCQVTKKNNEYPELPEYQ